MKTDPAPIAQASPEAVQALREASRSNPGARWAAYQNMALDSALAGHIQFLAIGPTNTYTIPPGRYPADTRSGMGWRYLFIGWVDLDTGCIIPNNPQEPCSFCGHTQEEHKPDKCWGTPLDPHLDAGGECPCQGFTPRKEN